MFYNVGATVVAPTVATVAATPYVAVPKFRMAAPFMMQAPWQATYQSQLPASVPPPLSAGSQVRIEGKAYQIQAPLGMGSFGDVWQAVSQEGQQVAIKEIICMSEEELSEAMLESNLLRKVHTCRPGHLTGRVPDLVACETLQLGSNLWLVRLAMTKLPGTQLDKFMAKWEVSANRIQTIDNAISFVRSLISQLSVTLEGMSTVAVHRDVSTKNILVDGWSTKQPRFGLVDFGLSCDYQQWNSSSGASSWQNVEVSGDGRYWAVSAWVMFVSGARELERYPLMVQEYKSRLDFHALGITALEVLMTLLPAQVPAELTALRAAWDQYWNDASIAWQCMIDAFDSGMDLPSLKMRVSSSSVPKTIGLHITAIRQALKSASNACGRIPGGWGGGLDAQRLFNALLLLVGAGGVVGIESQGRMPSWQEVRASVDDLPESERGAFSLLASAAAGPFALQSPVATSSFPSVTMSSPPPASSSITVLPGMAAGFATPSTVTVPAGACATSTTTTTTICGGLPGSVTLGPPMVPAGRAGVPMTFGAFPAAAASPLLPVMSRYTVGAIA